MPARPILLTALAAVLLALPSTAAAATCSDYSNQAAAQSAADTRDGDGDGIYCESLPCPCARGGGSSGGGGGSSSSPSASKQHAQQQRARERRRAAERRQARARQRARARRRADERRERLDRQRVERGQWRISQVVDGDTVKIRRTDGSARKTVRLIGIDTPESKKPGVNVECGALEATATALAASFSAPTDTDGDGLLDTAGARGVLVRLRTDRTGDLEDRFGRLLGYLDAVDDLPAVAQGARFDLAQVQVAAGNSTAYRYQGRRFQRYRAYARAQQQARTAGLGAWGACGGDFHSEQ